MRLRTRLFVYTGSVFLAIGIFSFFLQNHVIKSNLLKEKNSLHKEIQRLNEKQMKSLALYVEEMLLDYKTKINAVLAAFLQYPVLRQDFNPGTMPTWLDSATLIMNNKWLDVVENIKNKKVASSILLQERPLPRVPCKVLGQEAMVAWLEGGRPVVAVPWFVAPRGEVTPKEALPTSFYALFDVETLLQIDASQQKIEKLQLHIEPLHLFLQWMQLQEYTTLLQNFMQSLQKTQEELKKDPELLKGLLQPTQESKELMAGSAESSLAKLIDHYDEIGMIWGFAMLLQTGFFGESPFNPKAPLGIMKVEQGKPYGDILLKEAVFTTKPSLYALEGHPPSSIWQETLKVILFKESGRFFLGNSLHLTQGTDESTLTIGVDGDVVCR
ncbi:MAG: hypothetical protein FJZ63_06865, partial [Chlamydiae bacterium]|nr:hypothetical protein [Chlamydiota bacterium]